MAEEFTIERNAECRLRDGVILRADIFRPAAPGRFPVLLCRTPYDKTHPRYRRIAEALAQRGYIAVIQDIRGRDSSDGIWEWHLTEEGQAVESRDGYDACEWAARLDGADGQVGTWGNSYPSWLIWRMAIANPPSLKAIFTSGFSARTLDCTNGIFETGIRLRWQHHMAVSSRRRAGDTAYPQTPAEALHHWDQLLRGKWVWHLPLNDVPDMLYGPDASKQRQYWADVNKEFWALDRDYNKVTVPTMTLTGWWDRLNQCAFHQPGMEANGPQATRGQHRLVIGPWIHDVEGQPNWHGPRDYGPESHCDLVGEMLLWYDFHLKGRDTGLADEAPVRLRLINDNDWTYWSTWPPQGIEETSFFLRSDGSANTPDGNGTLGADAPGDEPADHFVYDPADPVPSLVDPDGQAAACDQRPLKDRTDILVFQTPPLERDLVLAGPAHAELWIASDAPDTDFVVRLIEVGADGLAVNLSHGILRCRYREGYDREVMLSPGEPTRIVVKLLPIGIRFEAGSRLRVDITSSDFPTFDRNHNTGKTFHNDTELRVARQTLFHDADRPSRLVLPVLPDA
jgi:putative CocE/NonD family hydrolase